MDSDIYKEEVSSFITREIEKGSNHNFIVTENDIFDQKIHTNLKELTESIPDIIDEFLHVDDNQLLCDCMEKISMYLHTPNLKLAETFELKEFVEKTTELLVSAHQDEDRTLIEKLKIFILTSIYSLWFYIDTNSAEDSLWLNDTVIDAVLTVARQQDRSIVPVAYFALANYAAISEQTTIYLFQHNILEILLKFLTTWTSTRHTRAGLYLAINLMNFRNEEIYDSLFQFIPCFRCNMNNIDSLIRNQACACLSKLCEYEPAMDACIECEVPEAIYQNITKAPDHFVYRAFHLIDKFLKSPSRGIFLTSQFVNSLSEILEISMNENSKEETAVGDVFIVLLLIEEDLRKEMIQYEIYQKTCQFIMNGYSELKLSAGVFLSVSLLSLQKDVKDNLIDEHEAVQCICSIVPLLKEEEEEKIIFNTLHSLILSDFNKFADIFVEFDVLDTIESIEDDLSPEVKEMTDGILTIFKEREEE